MARIPVRDYRPAVLLDHSKHLWQSPNIHWMRDILDFGDILDENTKSVYLCEACRFTDVSDLFAQIHQRLDLEPNHNAFLFPIRHGFDPKCCMCDLAASLPQSIRSQPPSDGSWCWAVCRSAESAKGVVCLYPATTNYFGDGPWSNIASDGANLIDHGIVLPVMKSPRCLDATRSSITYDARIVEPGHVNYSLLRSWIAECKMDHDQNCRNFESLGAPMRTTSLNLTFIDCQTRLLAQHLTQVEYYALSYTWGATAAKNGDGLVKHGSTWKLPDQLPRTVEDAITVVLEIGGRYLWIDRYCILDNETKFIQIRNMDLIYAGAIATIVAVTGSDADAGLCGVSYPRSAQPVVRLNNITFAKTFPSVSKHLQESTWSTRGWTYQELIVSRRCLFFTSDQVYYACRDGTDSEDIWHTGPAEYHAFPRTFGPQLLKFNDPESPNAAEWYLQDYSSHLQNYSARHLTYDADILRAFSGIMSALKMSSLWGMLYLDNRPHEATRTSIPELKANLFKVSLLWKRSGEDGSRRKGFPSWSWATVKGEIMFSDEAKWTVRGETAEVGAEGPDGRYKPIERFCETYNDAIENLGDWTKVLIIRANITQIFLHSTESYDRLSVYHLPSHFDRFQTPPDPNLLELAGFCVLDLPSDKTRLFPVNQAISYPLSAVQITREDELSMWILLDMAQGDSGKSRDSDTDITSRLGLIRSRRSISSDRVSALEWNHLSQEQRNTEFSGTALHFYVSEKRTIRLK